MIQFTLSHRNHYTVREKSEQNTSTRCVYYAYMPTGHVYLFAEFIEPNGWIERENSRAAQSNMWCFCLSFYKWLCLRISVRLRRVSFILLALIWLDICVCVCFYEIQMKIPLTASLGFRRLKKRASLAALPCSILCFVLLQFAKCERVKTVQCSTVLFLKPHKYARTAVKVFRCVQIAHVAPNPNSNSLANCVRWKEAPTQASKREKKRHSFLYSFIRLAKSPMRMNFVNTRFNKSNCWCERQRNTTKWEKNSKTYLYSW